MKKITGTRGDDGLSPDYQLRSTVYGLGGDDTLYFRDYARDDRFFGGPGDDTLRGVEAVLPAGRGAFEDGLFFDGGPGFDKVLMELRVDRSDTLLKLGQLYGTLRNVEAVEVELELDAQNGRPLDDLRVRGTMRADTLELYLDDGTSATDLRLDLRGGADVVEIRDGGFVGTRIEMGRGADTYIGEDNRFIAAEGDTVRVAGGAGTDTFVLGWAQETAFGGRGADVFFTSSSDTVDTLRGGRGADHFVFDVTGVSYGLGHRAHIGDFRSGTDTLVVVGRTANPVDAPTPLEIGRDNFFWAYDRAAGELTYLDVVVATFGEGTRVAFGDLVLVNDYDQML